jgi:hypothetical protein
MVAGGLTEKVLSDRSQSFYFYSCGHIPPPVIMVQVLNKHYFCGFNAVKILKLMPLVGKSVSG